MVFVAVASGQADDVQSPTKSLHPGRILNRKTGGGMVAQATAYSPGAKRTSGGTPNDICPGYDDPNGPPVITWSVLPTGDFTFEVDPKYSVYRSQYCAGGFLPETRVDNMNTPGAPVAGNPIRLQMRD
jgi:hypothetical protein